MAGGEPILQPLTQPARPEGGQGVSEMEPKQAVSLLPWPLGLREEK